MMSKINEGFLWIFSTVAKMFLHNIDEIEKREVEFSMLYPLVAREFNIMWQHLIFNFNFITYIDQLLSVLVK